MQERAETAVPDRERGAVQERAAAGVQEGAQAAVPEGEQDSILVRFHFCFVQVPRQQCEEAQPQYQPAPKPQYGG